MTKFENKCTLIFYENVRFLGKTQKLSSSMWEIFKRSKKFFLCSKEGFKYAKKRATKRISKKVLYQATLLYSIAKLNLIFLKYTLFSEWYRTECDITKAAFYRIDSFGKKYGFVFNDPYIPSRFPVVHDICGHNFCNVSFF
jgi:hypothetical protein